VPWIIAGVASAFALIGLGVLAGWLLARDGAEDAAPAAGRDTGAGAASDDDTEPTAGPIDDSGDPVELEPVEDDTGVIQADIPVVWDDRDLAQISLGEPNILAADDIDRFYLSYDVAGISIIGFAADSPVADRYFDPTDTFSMEDTLWFFGRFAGDRGEIPMNACADVDEIDFDQGGVHGVMDVYTGCGENGTEVVAVAGTNEEETVGAFVEMIVTDGDEKAAVDAILTSIRIDFLE
jgi:hypothetical protein